MRWLRGAAPITIDRQQPNATYKQVIAAARVNDVTDVVTVEATPFAAGIFRIYKAEMNRSVAVAVAVKAFPNEFGLRTNYNNFTYELAGLVNSGKHEHIVALLGSMRLSNSGELGLVLTLAQNGTLIDWINPCKSQTICIIQSFQTGMKTRVARHRARVRCNYPATRLLTGRVKRSRRSPSYIRSITAAMRIAPSSTAISSRPTCCSQTRRRTCCSPTLANRAWRRTR
jgi:hypothetical protein